MSLLPRSAEEFSSAEYWERFFRRRGDKAFEWYADYNQLCGLLHKYIKPRDRVLVVGCGNSDLSEQLYDVGYRQLVNIDISDTVVSHMRQRNAERRPDLTFLQADATQTTFDGSSFQAALDKGTLDAMAAEEGGSLAGSMLAEVGRVLVVGGRYVCVSLAQESVLRLAVEHFVREGWAIRVHCLGTPEEQDTPSDSTAFALPVFMLVCTKFRQPPPTPVLEMCQGEDGAPCRLSSTTALLSAVRERQAYALVRHKLRSGPCVGRSSALTLCHAPTGHPRYTLTVLDSPQLAKVPRANHFAIFIVPQGRESDWLYGSAEGREQLARSANFRRLVVVAMHRDQEYADMQSVQSELSPMVMELAPCGMPANQQVPFLSVGGELGWREVVSRGVSTLSGEYSVEDVRGEDGFLYRRLVFLDNAGVVQSENRLRAPAPAPSGKRNKKKKSKPPPPAVKGGAASVDRSFLCCAHHRVMVAGLSLLGLEDLGPPITLLLVGLGGGGLPQFLRDFIPGVSVDVVELDPAVLDVAQRCFGFQPDERLKVVLGDGLEHISASEAKGGCAYDVIMFDVDCKDPTLGMSCPPPAFVETAFLEKVRNLLTARGVFMLNLVCRDSALRARVLGRVRDVFPCVLSRDIEGEVNEVLLCIRRGGERGEKDRASPEELRKACRRLQGALHTPDVSHKAQIDVAALLEDLKIA
ncbi:eEF1A lysine and N-terminal methyltransferase isoform X2 [Brienomyrus brachyistius]|uniref:eEF1A lysine and N-terminal methyltransferase isoform X2 n=1 Tax=Brienomyrus brachyistius TaxID=42636 RepID=UPI0020B3BD50|nr:eEF1A lysine and N-terminal methyltransferase isoform X2 [Brienomyrus brachyistius]